MKTDFIRARVEPDLKSEVHHIFDEMGVTPTQAIIMFYKYVQREHSFPFSLKIPNAETRKAMEETEQGIGLIEAENINDLFDDLDDE